MQRHKFQTVDEFISSFPKATQTILKQLRLTIKTAIPKAEQTISYNIPCFKLSDKYVVYFAGYSGHVSIYPIPKNITGFKTDIAKYKAGKGTLRFSNDQPLPLPFIKKVVKQLAKESLTRTKKSP